MKKFLLGLIVTLLGGILILAPVSAISCPDNCTQTSILGDTYDANGNKEGSANFNQSGEHINCSCDNGNGESIFSILNLVVDIMSIGIGILGVIGITVVGIQYLTAGGSEEKTRKAKRRMFEIVIGLVLYVLIYALLKWLLPGVN